jgi:serine O-acetyltransferase
MDAVGFYRLGRWLRARGVRGLPSVLRWLGQALHGVDLPPEAEIGPGLGLGYGGLGVAVDPQARLGRCCFLGPGATIGRQTPGEGAPVLGDFVYVSTGARILGPVRVGDYAVIGANAVVVEDVAYGAVVAGVPAVELRRDPTPEETRRRFQEKEQARREEAARERLAVTKPRAAAGARAPRRP